MLANVLLRTQGKNQLLVAATDLNVSLTAELKSQNTAEGGITLGAKNLYELIANAPGDEVSLKKADNHWAEIHSMPSMKAMTALEVGRDEELVLALGAQLSCGLRSAMNTICFGSRGAP